MTISAAPSNRRWSMPRQLLSILTSTRVRRHGPLFLQMLSAFVGRLSLVFFSRRNIRRNSPRWWPVIRRCDQNIFAFLASGIPDFSRAVAKIANHLNLSKLSDTKPQATLVNPGKYPVRLSGPDTQKPPAQY